MNENLRSALNNWFSEKGAYVLVDGQYGSTGKGLMAGALAECFWGRVNVSISNAGPNSGHTSYLREEKIVLKQLPTFGVTAHKIAKPSRWRGYIYLDAGAIVDQDIVSRECNEHCIDLSRIFIHSNAAYIDNEMRDKDAKNVESIASTGQGVGPALIRKLSREEMGIYKVAGNITGQPPLIHDVCFLEVPQGFSLGINSSFYPNVTSRECTVSQALADAGVPPSFHRKTIMSLRTFPIRVGDTVNTSGGYYPDQEEITWADLGVEPEMTTVTGRIRRVFTWSDLQFEDALRANAPDVLFLNFMNYLLQIPKDSHINPCSVGAFVGHMQQIYERVMRRQPDAILLGFGSRSKDIVVWGG